MAEKTQIEIRLTVSTRFGPVGPYDFPDTEKGRSDAEKKAAAIREYIARHH